MPEKHLLYREKYMPLISILLAAQFLEFKNLEFKFLEYIYMVYIYVYVQETH